MEKDRSGQNTHFSKYFREDWLIPIIVHLFALLCLWILALLLKVALKLPLWWASAIAATIFALILIFRWESIFVRNLRLNVYQEVSSSQCGDNFLALAKYMFSHRRLQSKALEELRRVAHIRKHPNHRFLQSIEEVSKTGISQPNVALVQRMLAAVPAAKLLAQERTIRNAAQFLRSDGADKYLVLYGYSKTVCEALVRAKDALLNDIYLIEDLQYGEESLEEHKRAQEHLEKGGIAPILLPFEEIGRLCSRDTDFVRSEAGSSFPVENDRKLLALIGCEAVDIKGTVLIPSKRSQKFSETAKFVEKFRNPGVDQIDRSVSRSLVVVAESYKVYPLATSEMLNTCAPVKISFWQRVAYLAGIGRAVHPQNVELVKLRPTEFYALIDDTGAHKSSGDVSLRPSYMQWQQQSTEEALRPGVAMDTNEIFQACNTVIFDKDGVLAQNEHAHFAAFTDAVKELGATLTYQEYLNYCSGLSDDEGARNIIQDRGLAVDATTLVRSKTARYKQYAASSAAFPMAVDLVRFVTESRKTAFLVTASSQNESEAFLTQSGMACFFQPDRRYFNVQSRDRSRIYSDIVLLGGGDPAKCLLLDDSPQNIEIAKSRGIRTIAFATTRPEDEFRADGVVGRADDLLTRLQSVAV
jgi:beta-phosphoglucomutase